MSGEGGDIDVLCLVGTDHHPFDRLVQWMDDWQRDNESSNVVVQHGFTSSKASSGVHYRDFVAHDDLNRLLNRAQAVVCHGGPGTIFDCRSAGLLPVVVPRTSALHEHVDDHQGLFTRRLHDAGLIDRVESFSALSTALSSALERGRVSLEMTDDAAVRAATIRLAQHVETLLTERGRYTPRPKRFKTVRIRPPKGG